MTARTLSLTEAAAELGLNPGRSGTAGMQRLYKMALRGELRITRIGRSIRVPRDEVDRLAGGQARSA
ncbi:MAG: helix-turn-helix domain-containing protein [Labedaea sp.]